MGRRCARRKTVKMLQLYHGMRYGPMNRNALSSFTAKLFLLFKTPQRVSSVDAYIWSRNGRIIHGPIFEVFEGES